MDQCDRPWSQFWPTVESNPRPQHFFAFMFSRLWSATIWHFCPWIFPLRSFSAFRLAFLDTTGTNKCKRIKVGVLRDASSYLLLWDTTREAIWRRIWPTQYGGKAIGVLSFLGKPRSNSPTPETWAGNPSQELEPDCMRQPMPPPIAPLRAVHGDQHPNSNAFFFSEIIPLVLIQILVTHKFWATMLQKDGNQSYG